MAALNAPGINKAVFAVMSYFADPINVMIDLLANYDITINHRFCIGSEISADPIKPIRCVSSLVT